MKNDFLDTQQSIIKNLLLYFNQFVDITTEEDISAFKNELQFAIDNLLPTLVLVVEQNERIKNLLKNPLLVSFWKKTLLKKGESNLLSFQTNTHPFELFLGHYYYSHVMTLYALIKKIDCEMEIEKKHQLLNDFFLRSSCAFSGLQQLTINPLLDTLSSNEKSLQNVLEILQKRRQEFLQKAENFYPIETMQSSLHAKQHTINSLLEKFKKSEKEEKSTVAHMIFENINFLACSNYGAPAYVYMANVLVYLAQQVTSKEKKQLWYYCALEYLYTAQELDPDCHVDIQGGNFKISSLHEAINACLTVAGDYLEEDNKNIARSNAKQLARNFHQKKLPSYTL